MRLETHSLKARLKRPNYPTKKSQRPVASTVWWCNAKENKDPGHSDLFPVEISEFSASFVEDANFSGSTFFSRLCKDRREPFKGKSEFSEKSVHC